MLNIGQILQFNNRRWHIRHIEPVTDRSFSLDMVGASDAAQGMSRQIQAICYGDHLFLEQGRHPRYWQAHLKQDWVEELYGPVLHCQPTTWLELINHHTQHPALGELVNEFTWSYARMNRYHHCPRAYYYHYYVAWEGWLDTAPAAIQRTYLLKNLTDVPRWIGTLVHESIKFALARLKAGQPVLPSELIQQMHQRAQADFSASQSGSYQELPNQLTGFQEHYYHTGLSQTDWQAAWQKAQQHLTTFLNSALYADLQQQAPATFLDVETLQSFTFNGTKIWVQMDFARLEDQTLYIYDWKTGRVGDEASLGQQLGVYGLFFRQIHPEWLAGRALRGVVYDLAQDQVIELDLDPTTLQQIEATMQAGIDQLRDLLLDREANLASLDRFPMINDHNICRKCQFRELCGR